MKKLKDVFCESLNIEEDIVTDELEYNSIPEWNSVAHMKLVAAIDENCNIMLETEDVIDMSTYGKIKAILSKYNVSKDIL